MENFVVSARKYRPETFEHVVGQEHVTTTLKNAIDHNQLAQALLFCGPRGVGKTTCARILAKQINEFDEKTAAGSLNIFELDAASNNSVEDIRNLIDQVRYPPQQGKFKVYIIDEVHMLSNAAFNAFLKTLEEPPSYAIFILATTEKNKVIPTILSRCQIYDFKRIQVHDIVDYLKKVANSEKIKTEEEALHLIAQKADGALRDALSLFDLIATFSSEHQVSYQSTIKNLHILDYDYYFKMTDFLISQNSSQALLLFDQILAQGFDGHNFIVGLSEHFRNLMVCKDAQTISLLQVSESVQNIYKEQAENTSLSFLLSSLNLANQYDLSYKSSKNQRLHIELALLKISHIPDVLTISQSPLTNQQKKKIDYSSGENKLKVKPEEDKSEPSSTQKLVTKTVNPISAPEIKKPQGLKKTPKLTLVTEEPPPYAEKQGTSSETKEPIVDENYSDHNLKDHWKSYAQKIKAQGKDSEFTILNQELSIKEHTIEIKLKNAFQEDILERFKADLLQYLRENLKNNKIKITTHLIPQKESELIYTSQEKFNHLAKKNPHLKTLKDKLGLDTEF